MVVRQFPFGSKDYEAAVALRTRVLREPLGLMFSKEDLALESPNIHIGAFDGEKIAGCLQLERKTAETVKMRQVAVEPALQGRGIGKKLVEFSENTAMNMGFAEITLNARDTAVRFYLALNYEIYGEPFEEVTIPHRSMRKRLSGAPQAR